jgi:subtilase family serine protease
LPRSVPAIVERAVVLGRPDPQRLFPILVSLNFARPDDAQTYADAVSDPKSPLYRQFLTPAEIAARFGPSEADYAAVVAHLRANGLRIVAMPVNRMTVRAEGTAAQIEAAFGTRLRLYREGEQDRWQRVGLNGPPRVFFANATPVRLPAAIAPLVQGVAGLENYVRATSRHKRLDLGRSSSPYAPDSVRTAYDLLPLYSADEPVRGEGRTIGIVALGYTNRDDTARFLDDFSLPLPPEGPGTNLTFIDVNGGADPDFGTDLESNLDLQMVLGIAPLANIRIYNSESSVDQAAYFVNYLAVVSTITSENAVDIVTDSWGITPGTVSGYNQFHTQHLMMTLQGITYLNASGDFGSNMEVNGLYPQTDPEVLSVGGTVAKLNGQDEILSEVGWHGSAGGYSDKVPFPRPAYQAGRGVPTTPDLRLVPDIALHSAGPNDSGAYLFYANGVRRSAIGTSFAAPICAGALALVEEYLIRQNALAPDANDHYRLGRLNDRLYAMNGRDDVFRDITIGGSDGSRAVPQGYSCTPFWDFVTGWGSLRFYNLAVALAAPLAVTVDPVSTEVSAGHSLQLQATVQGSTVQTVAWSVVSGPGSIDANGVYTAPPTDAVSEIQTAVVRATSTINTAAPVSADATIIVVPHDGTPITLDTLSLDSDSAPSHTTVGGKLTLTGPAPERGAVVALTTNKPSVATVPATVKMENGATTQTFALTTKGVLVATPVTVIANYNGVTATATLTVYPSLSSAGRSKGGKQTGVGKLLPTGNRSRPRHHKPPR